MTNEMLNERAFFPLKSLGFYEDFDTFENLSVIKQAKRVFLGGYSEEVIKVKMYRKKIDSLLKRWHIKDYVSIVQS